MKQPISLLAIAALAVSGAASMAQTQYQAPSQTQVTPEAPSSSSTTPPATTSTMPPATTSTMPAAPASPPAATATAPTPAPTVVETKVDLTTEPGPPADMRAAREEARNALAWAKSEGCRSDRSPRDCVRQAQAEHDRVLAQLGGGSVSGSGTSMAGKRGDRN
ncbi:hypothetical protein [Piscinibacter sp. XHJ-5]|uniref:hypothetical protein n=1 Tax=Piscinibacter sp. XHJ-5 TaxID=3037797 RepID=UPI002453071F|nr:hypothetical protein [Piscinibacter sp. XHJ-5]